MGRIVARSGCGVGEVEERRILAGFVYFNGCVGATGASTRLQKRVKVKGQSGGKQNISDA